MLEASAHVLVLFLVWYKGKRRWSCRVCLESRAWGVLAPLVFCVLHL